MNMKPNGCVLSLLFLASCVMQAQTPQPIRTTVAPGKQSSITVEVGSASIGDLIDVLVSDVQAGVDVGVFLPDGRELTEQIMDQEGLTFEAFLQSNQLQLDPAFRKALLPGPGDHLLLGFLKQPHDGSYRIRIDNRAGKTPQRVSAKFVRTTGLQSEALRSMPGVVISNTVLVPPASTNRTLSLSLIQSSGEAVLDVASNQNSISVRLRLPDGTVITRENAPANGFRWDQIPYPPDPTGDAFDAVFVAGILSKIMLPVNGIHSIIDFPNGVPQTGPYILELDGQRLTVTAQVSAMFVPMASVLKESDAGLQRLRSQPQK